MESYRIKDTPVEILNIAFTDSVQLYPKPASDKINVQRYLKALQTCSMVLFDVSELTPFG